MVQTRVQTAKWIPINGNYLPNINLHIMSLHNMSLHSNECDQHIPQLFNKANKWLKLKLGRDLRMKSELF